MKHLKNSTFKALFAITLFALGLVSAEAQTTNGVSSKPSYWSDAEYAVFAEVNKVRSNPREYANSIRSIAPVLRRFVKSPGEYDLAINEALQYLENAEPVGPLKPSYGLTLSAQEHAKYLNDTNSQGYGPNPVARLNRYGTVLAKAAENLEMGEDTIQEAIAKLIIDAPVPDRGHRKNIMDPDFQFLGVAIGSHPTWDQTIITDFASEYRENHSPDVHK